MRFDKIESQESQNEINDLENLSLEEKYFEIKPDTIFIESSKETTEETKQQSGNTNKLVFNKDVINTLENRNGSNNRGVKDSCACFTHMTMTLRPRINRQHTRLVLKLFH